MSLCKICQYLPGREKNSGVTNRDVNAASGVSQWRRYFGKYSGKLSVKPLTMEVYVLEYVRNQTIHITERRSGQMDKKISKLVKIVRSLTQLALEIGTLIAVVKMIVESIL